METADIQLEIYQAEFYKVDIVHPRAKTHKFEQMYSESGGICVTLCLPVVADYDHSDL